MKLISVRRTSTTCLKNVL